MSADDNREIERKIKLYNRERNAMLMQRDPAALMAFMRERGLQVPSSRDSAEVTLHKTITGVVSLPRKMRRASKRWLIERGFHSLDDGDL